MKSNNMFWAMVLTAMMMALTLPAKDFLLIEAGKTRCEIVLPENANPTQSFAARELAKFLAKISGGEEPGIVDQAGGKLYPISFQTATAADFDDEGFCLHTTEKGLVIEAKKPVGFLFGAYEILKRYGGIRWLVPGQDGEYYTTKATISVPEGRLEKKPSVRLRSGNNLGLSIEGREWLVRNNMRVPSSRSSINNSIELQERAALAAEGYHCFSRLLTGEFDYKKINARLDELYKEKPEYFPLINGKRVNLLNHNGFSDKQPCTSNPEVIRIMTDNLAKVVKERVMPDGIYLLYDNDGTGWCQCDTCKAQDSASDRRNGTVVNRYWIFLNAIVRKALDENPGAVLIGNPYQNFKDVPEDKNLIDRRLWIELGFNRTCWRHNIDDPNCLTNREYLKKYLAWAALGHPMTSWEQLTSAGAQFLPVEKTVLNRMQFYEKINCAMFPEVFSPYTNWGKPKPRMADEMWLAMWQSMYLMAALQWDRTQDADAIYEEINSLYYGQGWAGGMKELRALLIKTFSETPGCAGHGHSAPLGKMLEKPGVQDQIEALFNQAEKAAAKDPDKRALAHVQRDREYFNLVWVKENKAYKENFREIRAYGKTAPIIIDGILEEQDWKDADIIANFTGQYREWGGKVVPNNQQTFVRTVYEPDYIYFAIEAMEPTPDKMVSEITQKDGPVWTDNTLEIFISHPDMGENYFQLIFNAKGVLFDQGVRPGEGADKGFDSGAEYKTRILPDRWVLEMRIPSDNLGEKCFDGQIWKVNIMRRRYLSDGTNIPTSWSRGEGAAVSAFQTVNFSGKRKLHLASANEMDTRWFANGTFDEVEKSELQRNGWTIVNGLYPKTWMAGGSGGAKPAAEGMKMEMVEHPEQKGNYYLTLSGNGMFFQRYRGVPDNVKMTLRAKGKGVLWVYVIREIQKEREKAKSIGAYTLGTITVDSEAWQNFSFSFSSDTPDLVIFPGFRVNSGTVSIDDVVVRPVGK